MDMIIIMATGITMSMLVRNCNGRNRRNEGQLSGLRSGRFSRMLWKHSSRIRVDVSPLSTIGAICLAAYTGTEDRQVLFNKVLAWGLSMAVVGAVVCWVFFGLL